MADQFIRVSYYQSAKFSRVAFPLWVLFFLLFTAPVTAGPADFVFSATSPDDYEVTVYSLPGVDLYGFSIDVDGRIMGRYQDDHNAVGAFVWDGEVLSRRAEAIRPAAISADGTIVGWSGFNHQPLAKLVDPTGEVLSSPFASGRIRGINRSGQLVGERLGPEGGEVVLVDGSFEQVLGQARRCRVAGLNEATQVAFSLKDEGGFRAYLWDFTSRSLGDLGGGESLAKGLNQRGDVVGDSRLPDGSWHAFIWSDGQMQDLGTLGGASSHALAVNEQRVVVGWSLDSQGRRHNVLWKDGQIFDLEPLLGEMGIIFGLNDLNQLVGWQKGPQGHWQAIVVTPRSG